VVLVSISLIRVAVLPYIRQGAVSADGTVMNGEEGIIRENILCLINDEPMGGPSPCMHKGGLYRVSEDDERDGGHN